MSLKNHLINLFKGNHSVVDVWYYLQGNFRYRLYYSRWKFFIRRYIREQIGFRISVMRRECFDNGECVMCGCQTTALQMCNKVCDGMCYPPMMWWHEWVFFKKGEVVYKGGLYWKFVDQELYFGKKSDKLEKVCGNSR